MAKFNNLGKTLTNENYMQEEIERGLNPEKA
jgi:hypothetical protein